MIKYLVPAVTLMLLTVADSLRKASEIPYALLFGQSEFSWYALTHTWVYEGGAVWNVINACWVLHKARIARNPPQAMLMKPGTTDRQNN